MLALTLTASLALAQAPSLTAYADSIDQRLVSVLVVEGTQTIHTRYHTVQVGRFFWDEDVERVFADVPAAFETIHKARLDNLRGTWLTLGSFAASGAGLGLVLAAAFLGGPVAMLVAAIGLELVALVLSIVGLVFRQDAEAGLLRAADEYNHGLLVPPQETLPPPPPPGASMQPGPAPAVTLLRF